MKRKPDDESRGVEEGIAVVKRKSHGGCRGAEKGSKGLSVRQRRFIAELAEGKTQRGAAAAAGYAYSSSRGSTLLKSPNVREALGSELEAQGLTYRYLVARIKDLCEASDEREDGRITPSWIARLKGVEVLMRLLGVDKQVDAVKLAFEETVSRMLEDAQAFDPGIEVREVGGSEGASRTEIVVLKGTRSPLSSGETRENKKKLN